MSQKDNVDIVDVRADLKLMETELVKIQDELAKAETSRNQLIQKLHYLIFHQILFLLTQK